MRLVLGIFLVAGCANMSAFQTGRTQGKGELRYGVGAEINFVDEFEVITGSDEDETSEIDTAFPIPGVVGWARYGVADNLDFGLRLHTVGLGGEMKAQFAGEVGSPFAAAA